MEYTCNDFCDDCKYMACDYEQRIASLESQVAELQSKLRDMDEQDRHAKEMFKLLDAENKRLRQALEKYGRHLDNCDRFVWDEDLFPPRYVDTGKCTCGFNEALSGIED